MTPSVKVPAGWEGQAQLRPWQPPLAALWGQCGRRRRPSREQASPGGHQSQRKGQRLCLQISHPPEKGQPHSQGSLREVLCSGNVNSWWKPLPWGLWAMPRSSPRWGMGAEASSRPQNSDPGHKHQGQAYTQVHLWYQLRRSSHWASWGQGSTNSLFLQSPIYPPPPSSHSLLWNHLALIWAKLANIWCCYNCKVTAIYSSTRRPAPSLLPSLRPGQSQAPQKARLQTADQEWVRKQGHHCFSLQKKDFSKS